MVSRNRSPPRCLIEGGNGWPTHDEAFPFESAGTAYSTALVTGQKRQPRLDKDPCTMPVSVGDIEAGGSIVVQPGHACMDHAARTCLRGMTQRLSWVDRKAPRIY